MTEEGKKVSDIAVEIVILLKKQTRLTCLEIAERLEYDITDFKFDAAMATLESSNIIIKPVVYEINN